MPNIVKCFFPLLKLSMMDWDSLNKWSSVDLALLKPDSCLFKLKSYIFKVGSQPLFNDPFE